jgi:hypothetical protein
LVIVPATDSGNPPREAGPHWWDRLINALVPAALIAAMIAHALPFLNPTPGIHPFAVESGFSAFFVGFLVLTVAPLDPYFEAYSFPLIAAVVGLMFIRRRGRLGSAGPLVCALVGLTALGSAYVLDPQAPWAYGYFTAEGCFVIAAVAAAARLILLRRTHAVPDAAVPHQVESAASGSQELLSRYR